MYLKRLEIQGFKSFADKTILEFMPGITTVIGPNGSGKSNVSDAIRWVLGEQSMKMLRGSKSEDIIFAGTQNRKSLGFAEVSMIIDNSDGKLPIEFTEVTVTRRIYRSGESGYFLNKTACRLKDILELFMDTGIGKDGYSIISQGKIDEILSNKSEDRRHIFEEAAGIVKYRTRKVESEKKLEQTKQNLLRINDILTEIEGNIEPLKNQSEKAKKFLQLKEELKSIEIGLFLHQIDSYKQKLSEVITDMDIFILQEKDEDEKLIKLQENKETLKTEIDKITSDIEEIQNSNLESTKQQEKLNSDINVYNERIANNLENNERYELENEEIKKRNEQLSLDKEQKLDKKNNLTSNKERFEKELAKKEEELASLNKQLSEEEKKIETQKQQVQDNIDLKYEKSAFISNQEITIENIIKRTKTVKDDIDSNISELDNTRMTREDINTSFREIEIKKEKILKELEEINAKKAESNKQIKYFEDNINKLLHESRIKDSRCKFLIETEKEKEGYTKSVKTLLKECEKNNELAKGVKGVLASLISVPKEYEVAIEMSLGAALQNIVTETEKDAKKLIEFLRNNNLGRASFLPIASIKGRKIDKINKNSIEDGIIGFASDVVKVDSKYEQILLNLLGRTIIVKDMDIAIELAKQNQNSFKIVTLKGDIINAGGSITGGAVAQKTVNILGRAKEIENLQKELEKIDKNIKKLETERDEYLASIESILELSSGIERELQEIEIEYATYKEKILNIDVNILKLEEKLEKLREEKENLSAEKINNEELKETASKDIANLEQEIESLNLIISEFITKNKDKHRHIDDLNFDITNLKISVSSFDESEDSLNEFLERITSEIEVNNQSIISKKNLIEKGIEENKSLEELIIKAKEDIENIKNGYSESVEKIESLKNERIAKGGSLNKLEEDITNQFKLIEDIKAQISKIELKQSKIDFEIEQVTNKMWEEYEITPNNASEYAKPTNVNEVQKRVNSLRNEIKNLGSINIDSIEEYKQTKERYDFMCEQRLDLEESSAKLRKVISEMTGIMKAQFEEQFKIINRNFSEVFMELFGGGRAELILTDKENILESGIEIEVQPPGKKLQNMMLLSGGERAFTAIALLFAILKINPAPFCVLDEIEAALDDTNVYRFADYLKKFAKKTQFLVITHRKGTMEAANTVYGITMEENGISKLLSIKLK